jgi:rubrerythrin
MPFRNFIARLALNDARRFEAEAAGELQEILAGCEDPRTRTVLERIVREEEEHLTHLEAELARLRGKPAAAPKEKPPLPEAPRREKLSGTTLEKLERLLKKEQASTTFYKLLSERTPIPAVRAIFRSIAEQEKGHAAALAEHVREIGGDDGNDRKPPMNADARR